MTTPIGASIDRALLDEAIACPTAPLRCHPGEPSRADGDLRPSRGQA
jgi:hypothetical protein